MSTALLEVRGDAGRVATRFQGADFEAASAAGLDRLLGDTERALGDREGAGLGAIGARLQLSMVPPELEEALRAWARASAAPLLAVRSGDAALERIPWELLPRALGLPGLLVARVPVAAISVRPPVEPPAELVAAAWLGAGQEGPALAFRRDFAALSGEQLKATPLLGAATSRLAEVLRDKRPSLVHLVASHLQREGAGGALLVGGTTEAPLVLDVAGLAGLFGAPGPALVALQTCFGGRTMAPSLARRAGCTVLAWAGWLRVSTAEAFARHLYRRVLDGASAVEAVRSFPERYGVREGDDSPVPSLWLPSPEAADAPVLAQARKAPSPPAEPARVTVPSVEKPELHHERGPGRKGKSVEIHIEGLRDFKFLRLPDEPEGPRYQVDPTILNEEWSLEQAIANLGTKSSPAAAPAPPPALSFGEAGGGVPFKTTASFTASPREPISHDPGFVQQFTIVEPKYSGKAPVAAAPSAPAFEVISAPWLPGAGSGGGDGPSEKKPPAKKRVEIDLRAVPALCPALLKNGRPIFEVARVKVLEERRLRLEIVCDTGVNTSVYREMRDFKPADGDVRLQTLQFPVLYPLIHESSGRRYVSFTATVSDHAEVLDERTVQSLLLDFNEWVDRDDLWPFLPAFVRPQGDGLDELQAQATDLLTTLDAGASFDGYRRADPAASQQIEALYKTVGKRVRVSYSGPLGGRVYVPGSSDMPVQLVRFPADILRTGTATCNDLALLFASFAERVGLYPLLVLTPDHTFFGFWTSTEAYDDYWEAREQRADSAEAFGDRWTIEAEDLKPLVAKVRVRVVEATGVTDPKLAGNFNDATKHAREEYVEKLDALAAIDVQRSRREIQPL